MAQCGCNVLSVVCLVCLQVLCSVKKGKPELRKKVLKGARFLATCWWCRSAKNGYFQQFLVGLRACLMCMEASFIFSLMMLLCVCVFFVFAVFVSQIVSQGGDSPEEGLEAT